MNDVAPLPQSRTYRKIITFVIHLLVLMILFVLPDVLFNYGRSGGPNFFMVYSRSIVFVIAFYVNYYFLISRCIGGKHGVVKLALSNVALLLLCLGALALLQHLFPPPPRPRLIRQESYIWMRSVSFMLRDSVLFILTATLALAIKLGDNWMRLENRKKEEEAMRRSQELEGLRSQINPHFLFNTLNSIYALIAISAPKAQEAVHELSKLLRYVLYENPAMVSISSESKFIGNYVKLQRLRLPDDSRLKLSVHLAGHSEAQLPPMLLVTVVENVFKHADLSRDTLIEISADDSCITCHTTNTPRESLESKGTGGIGLNNLKRRLELLYGDEASLETRTSCGRFEVTLKIPIR